MEKGISDRIMVETDRIILREITINDAQAMFEMDADPEVHIYLGKKPIQTIDQAINQIQYIRQQYLDYGIVLHYAIQIIF